MYIIQRKNKTTGKIEYLAKDTARVYWMSRADKKWLVAFENKVIAQQKLETIEATYRDDYEYTIDTLSYSQSELKFVRRKPYDPVGPIEKDTSVI